MIFDVNGNAVAGSSQKGMSAEKSVTDGWTENAYVRTGGPTYAVGTIGTDTSTLKLSKYISTEGAEMLILRMPWVSTANPVSIGMCFYDKDKNVLTNAWVHYLYNRQAGDPYTKKVKIFIPEKAYYFRTTFWSDDYVETYCPDEPFVYQIGEIPDEDKPITHELPTCVGMMNTIRRARQLTDIEWETRVNIPRYLLLNGSPLHALDWFVPGHKYKGIPYSGSGEPDSWHAEPDPTTDSGKWGYYKFYVGNDLDFETFVTAVRFPNSIFSERTGRTTPSYDSSIYGIVCNGLTNYALGMSSPVLKISNYGSDSRLYLVADSISSENVQSITMLGDILWIAGHVMIVTDIKRDMSGTITDVEVSEATTVGNGTNNITDGSSDLGGICRRKFWSLEDYLYRATSNGYKVYRWKAFADMSYTRSDYVDTGNEGDFKKIIDLPCIPYLGNKAVYHVGSIVNSKVVINATGFTTLVVTKDGESFGSFALNGATEVSVGFSAAGSYEAHLVDANNKKSMSCYWTVE